MQVVIRISGKESTVREFVYQLNHRARGYAPAELQVAELEPQAGTIRKTVEELSCIADDLRDYAEILDVVAGNWE